MKITFLVSILLYQSFSFSNNTDILYECIPQRTFPEETMSLRMFAENQDAYSLVIIHRFVVNHTTMEQYLVQRQSKDMFGKQGAQVYLGKEISISLSAVGKNTSHQFLTTLQTKQSGTEILICESH